MIIGRKSCVFVLWLPKCYVMHMTNTRSPVHRDYKLCNQTLAVVKSHPYLGVHLQDDIGWSTHIQRSAPRFVKSNYEHTKGTVTTLLNYLKWQSLEERRKAARLTMMNKIVNEEIDIPSDRYLTPVTRLSRHNNSKSFIPHQTRLQSHRHSFFPRTIPEWNALPETW